VTFVLAYGNQDVVGQVSDRRLTDETGRPRVLPENKATVLTLADARLIRGFAGLARAGRFRTGEWILDALLSAAADDHQALGAVERFIEIATKRFREADLAAVPPEGRGLSLVFTGFRDVPGERHPLIAALVTNFQNFETGRDEAPWDEFRATYWSVRPGIIDPTYIQRIGQWPAMLPSDERGLRVALEQRRPPTTLDHMTVGLVREIAARPTSRDRVGKELRLS
jgi:hypothetical protein